MDTNLPAPSAQAEAMLRRVSPEGRAKAQRERERKRQATTRMMGKMALAALAVALVAAAIDLAVVPIGLTGFVIGALVLMAACAAISVASRERPPVLAQSSLGELPASTEHWLEAQRPLLPRAAVPLLDSIALRLEELAPSLAALDPAGPAAGAVRRLVATDLPALVNGYQAVPPTLRAKPDSAGRSADAQLHHGLTVIDGEMGRMLEQIARGAFDELATQDRFLELKYEAAGPGE